ncbi:MAG: exonuclease SbcCD subunit D [Candidatus Thorarchaeota archaeon]
MIESPDKLTISKKREERPVRFIHASDIHLGCQQYQSERRADDFIKAFKEILELAIEKCVDFVILAGDVFTSLEMLPGKLLKIISMLIEFKKNTNERIPIIAIEGNHDIRKFSFGLKLLKRGQSWLKLLSNLGLLILLDANLDATSVFQYYDPILRKGGKIQIKNVMIYGIRYIGQEPVDHLPKIRDSIKKEKGVFNILLQHYGIEGQMENVPGVKLEVINQFKDHVDYLALGHFHRQFVLDDWIYNPGSSEAACSIDATFKRGIFFVEVFEGEEFTKNVQIIRLQNRRHQWKVLFFPNHSRNKKEFYNFIMKKLEDFFNCSKLDLKNSNDTIPLLHLVLKGKKPMNSCKINNKELRNKIYERFPVLDINIYQKFTNPDVKLDKYIYSYP